MENSKISWCSHTFNPLLGCAKVSEACRFCYAEALVVGRFGKQVWGLNAKRQVTSDANWKKPLTWDKKAKAAGERHRVFCASLSDVFEDHPDWIEPRNRLWGLIDATPNLDWLLLTKRPENIEAMNPNGSYSAWPKNVWLGTTVENQEYADIRIPTLMRSLATNRFISAEPLLGPINNLETYRGGLDWCIIGGESGNHARPTKMEWIRSLRDQCDSMDAKFFMKQTGCVLARELGLKDRNGADLYEFPEDIRIQDAPTVGRL